MTTTQLYLFVAGIAGAYCVAVVCWGMYKWYRQEIERSRHLDNIHLHEIIHETAHHDWREKNARDEGYREGYRNGRKAILNELPQGSPYRSVAAGELRVCGYCGADCCLCLDTVKSKAIHEAMVAIKTMKKEPGK